MFQESYMRKIAAAVGLVAIIALLVYSYTTYKSTRYIYSGPLTISVSGKGEVFAKPDIASFSFSVEAKEADAVTAQNKVAETMKAITAFLKESGVEEKDIKTESFNLMPQYESQQQVCTVFGCPPVPEPKIVGYQVNQYVSVKVRKADDAGRLVSEVGAKGALNVSGLSFTIDDTDSLKAEARELAIDDAKEQAKKLAEKLDARIVRMSGFWEEEAYAPYYGGYGGGMDMAMSREGSMKAESAELPSGENTIVSKVSITYEIKPR